MKNIILTGFLLLTIIFTASTNSSTPVVGDEEDFPSSTSLDSTTY